MKRWEILNNLRFKNRDLRIDNLIKTILANRGLKTKKEIEKFLDPKLETVTVKNVGIDSKNLKKAIQRIQLAIKNKEQIVVFGDYDVDGICGAAILWETLNSLGAKVLPYIPHRVDEGYGLSLAGISNVKSQISNVKLIISVDNGIVANKAVKFAKEQEIDVIITDHHVPAKRLPDAFAIVHTAKLCGAGVAWLLAQEIKNVILIRQLAEKNLRDPSATAQDDNQKKNHLELVTLATIADLVPLLGANRTLVKFGLEALRRTKRVGLLELFEEAGLDPSKIGLYEVGHMIAPRLNAMGRLEYAMDSLRLLCTKNRERARVLAQTLGRTNRERQGLTVETVEHAKNNLKSQIANVNPDQIGVKSTSVNLKSLIFIAHESYQQGVIGLVAGKLVEEFYRPSIVVSIGEKYSKASARSINGFNIIEFIRGAQELLVDAGGHPMAAGFTVETSKLSLLQKTLEEKAEDLLDQEKLTRTLRIDCELDLSSINNNLYNEIQKLAPFGMGNPEPVFVSRRVVIEDMRIVGNEGKHLKLVVSQKTISSRHSGDQAKPETPESPLPQEMRDSGQARMTRSFDAIAFGMGERVSEFHIGDKVDIAYTIDENEWNGNKKLQLKIKDIK